MKKRTIQKLLSNETKKSGRWKKCFGLLLACSVITLTFDGSVYAAASGENSITTAGEVNILSSEFDDDEDEKVIPPDERVRVKNTKIAPYKYVGRLVYSYNGSGWQGTGALIGRRTVLTAAHCVYGAKVKGLHFSPGQNGSNTPYGTYDVAEVHIPEGYVKAVRDKNKAEKKKNDYAVMVLKQSLPSDHGYFRLGGDGTSLNQAGIKGLNLGIIGYPGEFNGMYRHASKKHSFEEGGSLLVYNIDTIKGQSGAPVYRKKNGKYYIIAVHAWGDDDKNSGKYLDSTVKQYIQKYVK